MDQSSGLLLEQVPEGGRFPQWLEQPARPGDEASRRQSGGDGPLHRLGSLIEFAELALGHGEIEQRLQVVRLDLQNALAPLDGLFEFAVDHGDQLVLADPFGLAGEDRFLRRPGLGCGLPRLGGIGAADVNGQGGDEGQDDRLQCEYTSTHRFLLW